MLRTYTDTADPETTDGMPPTMPDYTSVALDTPIVVPMPTMTIAGIRRHHRFEGFDFAAFPRQIGEVMDKLPDLTGRVGDRAYDVFWHMFDVPAGIDGFDYLIGVAVGEGASLPDGFTTLVLPAQAYAVVPNREGDDPRDTIYTLWHEWLPTTVHTPAPGQPQFIYERGDEDDGGPLDIWVPISS